MTIIHSQITNKDEIHVPKGFTETPTDYQRCPVKNIDGSLTWVRTDSFTGTQGPPGPPIQIISVTSIANPTELNSLNSSSGEQIMAIQYVPNENNEVGLYQWDSSSDIGNENSPYKVSGNGGMWILVGGFVNDWIINSTGSTTIVRGGNITINAVDNTKVDISETDCLFFDNYTNPEDNKTYYRKFPAQAGVDVLNLATADATLFLYDRDGNLIKTNTSPTPAQRREFCRIGFAWHPDGTLVSAGSLPQNNYAVGSTLFDLYSIIGPQNVAGNIYSPNGTNLEIDKSSGQTFSMGSNWSIDKKNPNFNTDIALVPSIFSTEWKSSATDWTITRNLTDIDPNNYNLGITLTAVPAGEFTIQRIFWGSVLQSTTILYGQKTYPDYDTALSSVNDPFEVPDNFAALGMVYRTALIVQQGVTDLDGAVTAGTCSFVNINPRFTGSTSGGTSSVSTLQSAYDASIDGSITATQTKGALKLRAETNLVPTLIEARDEINTVRFSVSRTGIITGATATVAVNGLMSSTDKTKLDGIVTLSSTTDLPEGTNLYYTETRVSANSSVVANTAKKSNLEAWSQYSNAAPFNTTGTIPVTINQNEDSFPNGLFDNPSSTQIRTLFDGYVEVFFSIVCTGSANDGHFDAQLLRSGIAIPTGYSSVSTGRGIFKGTGTNKVILSCTNGSTFSFTLTALGGQTYSCAVRNAKLCVRAIRVN